MANQEHVRLLVDALRSGEYDQTTGKLHYDKGYCCLGVGCEVAIKNGVEVVVVERDDGTFTYNGEVDYLPSVVQEWFGFTEDNPVLIDAEDDISAALATEVNDERLETFEVIANLIEWRYLS